MRIVVAFLCAVTLVFVSCASGQSSDQSGAGKASGKGTEQAAGGARSSGLTPVEIKAKVLFSNGDLDEYTESEYDDTLVNLLKQRRFSASGALLEQVEYTYSAGKNYPAKKVTRNQENQIKNSVEYQYDTQGDLISETLLNKDSKPVSSYSYSYDAKRNRTNRVFINGLGAKMAETTFSYDNRGNITATETLNGAGQKINSTQSQFDNAGNLTSQKIFNAGGQLTASTAIAWERGNEIKNEQFGQDGALQMRITNEYGANGELLKKTIEDLRGKTTQVLAFEYKFKKVSQ